MLLVLTRAMVVHQLGATEHAVEVKRPPAPAAPFIELEDERVVMPPAKDLAVVNRTQDAVIVNAIPGANRHHNVPRVAVLGSFIQIP